MDFLIYSLSESRGGEHMQKEKHTPAIDEELPENAQHRKLDHVFL